MEVSFLDQLLAPGFLNEIPSEYIGFGGGVSILLIWGWFNRKEFTLGGFIFFSLLVYGVSLGTGIGIGELGWVQDRASACIAGLWAPLVYCLMSSVVLYKLKENEAKRNKNDMDHLIGH